MQARQVLMQQFPDMEVLGTGYPVPPHKVRDRVQTRSLTLQGQKLHLLQGWMVLVEGSDVCLEHLCNQHNPPDMCLGVPQAFMAKVMTVAQYGSIGLLLGGEQLFPALGMPVPELYQQYRDKRMGIVLGIWLLGNALQNQLVSTGAFEVYYDGERVSCQIPLLVHAKF